MPIWFPLSQSTRIPLFFSGFFVISFVWAVRRGAHFAQAGNWSARSYNLIVILWEPNNIAGNCSPRTFLSSGAAAGSLIRKFCSAAALQMLLVCGRESKAFSPLTLWTRLSMLYFFSLAHYKGLLNITFYTHTPRPLSSISGSQFPLIERGENFRLVKMLFP